MNVLIIDDQASSRRVLRHILENVGSDCDLHEFESAIEALRWCSTSQADFVVVDYSMPGMDGIEFARSFRANPLNDRVPIMMLTVAQEASVKAAAVAAGIHDFITKPFAPRVVQARCECWLGMRRAQALPEAVDVPIRNDQSGHFKELGKRVMAVVGDSPANLDQSGHFKDLGRRIAEALRDMKGEGGCMF